MELSKRQTDSLTSILAAYSTGKPAYDSRLKAYTNFCKDKAIPAGTESLQKYIKSLHSVSTKNLTKTAVMTALKSIYENEPAKLYELEKVFKSVKAGRKNSIAIKADEVYSEETVNVMIEELSSRQNLSKKNNTDPAKFQKLGLIVWTLFNTGLRISELTGIRNQDVSLNGKATIKVLGKGSKERTVYLPKDAVMEIREVFESADSEYLFCNNLGRMMNRENLTNELSKALKSNYPDFHPHKLRHSFATKEIISKKKSVKAVSKYLGHSSTAITQDLYVHDELEFDDLEFTERKRA